MSCWRELERFNEAGCRYPLERAEKNKPGNGGQNAEYRKMDKPLRQRHFPLRILVDPVYIGPVNQAID